MAEFTVSSDLENAFQYNGQTYNAGDQIIINDACELATFIAAARSTNPEVGVQTGNSETSFQDVVDACVRQRGEHLREEITENLNNSAEPINLQPSPNPNESSEDLEDGDSADNQGAPGSLQQSTITITPDIEAGEEEEDENTRPAEGEPHPSQSQEQSQEQTNAGDPVDIFNGAFYVQETDLEIPNTIIPMVFTRYYRSGISTFGPFGWNWDHNYNLYIRELNNGNIALWRDLHENIYMFDGANFEPPRGVFERLEIVTGIAQAFEIKGKEGITMHFERPIGWLDAERVPIVWMRDRHGNQLTYTYGTEDKLMKVADNAGHFFQFEYDPCDLLVSVEDQAERRYFYGHNEETKHLTCVTSPPTLDYPKGLTKFYHYEQPYTLPKLRHNILRIEDSGGRVYLENKYEQNPASWSYARVTEQLYGGFLFQFRYTQLQWVPSNPIYINIPAVRAEVLKPDYGLETYTFNYRGDLIDHRLRLNKDKSFRVVIWQYEYDEQGNLSGITRPNGSREIYTFDAPHPDPRMRGNLLQREITSAVGFPSPSRIIWRGSYEENYQLLIEEENEINAVTQYRYDFDITPAAPNNSGKLQEIIYPDATLPDGRIQSCAVQFEHNIKGQITARINPDGTREEFVYGISGNETNRLIKSTVDPYGLNIENRQSYDTLGFSAELIDGNGNSIKFKYNSLGQIVNQTEPAIDGVEATSIFNYDTDKNIVVIRKPKGEYEGIEDDHTLDVTERDVLGYATRTILSENTTERREFTICNDYRGNPILVNNADKTIVKRKIDERGLLISEELQGEDGKILSLKKVYNRTGKIIQETSAGQTDILYTYDGFGRVTKVDLPNGSQVTNTWGKNDLLLAAKVTGDDGNGNLRLLRKVRFEYDEKNRRIREVVSSFKDDPTNSVDLE